MKKLASYVYATLLILGGAFACATEVSVNTDSPQTSGDAQPYPPPATGPQGGVTSVTPPSPECDDDPTSPDYIGPCPEPPVMPEPPTPTDPPSNMCPKQGSIIGLACDPNGGPIVGATVTVRLTDCTGNSFEAQVETDSTGQYNLDVPEGVGTLSVNAGSFERTDEVRVTGGQTIDLSNGERCLEATSTRIAVFTGLYDSIEHIIAGLGFEQDLFCGGIENYGARRLLTDPTRLQSYDVLFVNCGQFVDFRVGEGPQMAQNLRNFVEGGGSVYVSDISAGLIEAAYPELINFDLIYDPYAIDQMNPCCSCGQNCPIECDAQPEGVGQDEYSSCTGTMSFGDAFQCSLGNDPYLGTESIGSLQANILSPSLRAALGRDTFNVEFDLDQWVSINSTSPQVEVLITSDNRPLMVRYTSSAGGNLIYTSFHNERQASQDLQTILRALIYEL